jgi:hypothetical protein
VRGYRTARFATLCTVLVAGCFEPSYPVGLLCSPKGECPGDQVCIDHLCVLASAQGVVDGGSATDARVPVFVDATPCVPVAGDDPTCDGIDDDCDERFDEDAGSLRSWYRDRDGDGHGLQSAWLNACAQPIGYTNVSDDCWDSLVEPERSVNAHPGQTDFQDGVMAESTTGLFGDWDCDGTVVYEELACAYEMQLDDPRCTFQSYEGWLYSFPECGETEQFCSSWDEYEHYCLVAEARTQRCL